jgi:hypothetical protein
LYAHGILEALVGRFFKDVRLDLTLPLISHPWWGDVRDFQQCVMIAASPSIMQKLFLSGGKYQESTARTGFIMEMYGDMKDYCPLPFLPRSND